jgi:hypothetical protein
LEGRRGVVGVGVFILGNLESLVGKWTGRWRGEEGYVLAARLRVREWMLGKDWAS